MTLNFTAPVNSFSYGLVGLNVLKELVEQGIEVSWWPLGQVEAEPKYHEMLRQAQSNTQFYDKHSVSIRLFHENDLAQHVGLTHIGWPIFERTKFNRNIATHLKNQDELIVCSEWARTVVRSQIGSNIPVYVVPLGVDPDIFYPKYGASFLDQPTIFTHIGKKEYRKSQVEMIECFEKAFTPTDNVVLNIIWPSKILQVTNPSDYKSWDTRVERSPMRSRIRAINDFVPSQTAIAQILRDSDCGVFLSKSEGFNLGLLECLAVGTHAIATNWSGHTEYVTKDNCQLVEITEEEDMYDGVWFRATDGSDGTWAKFGDKQKEQTIDYMRAIHAKKQQQSLGINQKGIETGRKFSWTNTVNILKKFL